MPRLHPPAAGRARDVPYRYTRDTGRSLPLGQSVRPSAHDRSTCSRSCGFQWQIKLFVVPLGHHQPVHPPIIRQCMATGAHDPQIRHEFVAHGPIVQVVNFKGAVSATAEPTLIAPVGEGLAFLLLPFKAVVADIRLVGMSAATNPTAHKSHLSPYTHGLSGSNDLTTLLEQEGRDGRISLRQIAIFSPVA